MYVEKGYHQRYRRDFENFKRYIIELKYQYIVSFYTSQCGKCDNSNGHRRIWENCERASLIMT